MSRPVSVVLCAVASVALLVSCSSSTDARSTASPTAPSKSAESARPSLLSFDAPREFGGTPVPITLPALAGNLAGDVTSRFVLVGDRAYGVTGNGVGAVDLATGETLWQTQFPDAPDSEPAAVFYDDRGPGAPVVSADGSTVYATDVVEIAGHGTTASHYAIQLVAVDAVSGHLKWSVDAPAGDEVYDPSTESASVASVDDGRVVVGLAGDGIIDEGMVAAVDVASHAVLWSRPGSVQIVTAEVVVAIVESGTEDESGYPQLTGLDPATGEVLWGGGDDSETAVLGAHAIETAEGLLVMAKSYDSLDLYTEILDPRTGAVVRPLPGVVLYLVRDGDALYDLSEGIRAVDPSTFATVWELPQGNRVAPRNPVLFGGLVYGTVDGKGVVLDGTTGVDVTADIPGTFVAVNEHGALMLLDGEVVFVPATG